MFLHTVSWRQQGRGSGCSAACDGGRGLDQRGGRCLAQHGGRVTHKFSQSVSTVECK